jgi:hypothetical protein
MNRTSVLIPAFALFATTALAQTTNLVVNGSFETIAGPAPTNIGLGLPPWAVSGLDIVRPENGQCCYFQPADGLVSVSLNWTAPGSLSQVVTTVPGVTYEIRFWMAAEVFGGSPSRTMEVRWNGAVLGSPSFSYTGQGPLSMGWTEFVYTATGTGSDTLAFVSTTPNNFGPALDRVSVALPIAGAQTFGVGQGSSGCRGLMSTWVNGSPSVGNASFAITTSNAPLSGFGVLALGDVAATSDPLGIGLQFLVGASPGLSVALAGMTSDPAGIGALPVPIPSNPTLAGAQFFAQTFWLWSPTCPAVLPRLDWSSSSGLQLTIL